MKQIRIFVDSHKIRKFVLLYLISFLSLVLVGVPIVLATNGGTTDGGGGTTGGWSVPDPLGGKTFEQLVTDISYWIFNIGLPIAVIVIIYSGILFMMAGGNEEKINQAKKTFFWALIGSAIIIIGSGFISLIKDILGVK